jgi:hypothetical protein
VRGGRGHPRGRGLRSPGRGAAGTWSKYFVADLADWLKLKLATVIAEMAAKGIKGGGWVGLAVKISAYCP